MPEFKITVAYSVTNTIEAATQEEAEEKALEAADKLLEVSSVSPEVTDCEELPNFEILEE